MVSQAIHMLQAQVQIKVGRKMTTQIDRDSTSSFLNLMGVLDGKTMQIMISQIKEWIRG